MKRIIIKVLKLFIPKPIRFKLILIISRNKNRKQIQTAQIHYKQIVENIKLRPVNQKIRFGMYVVYDSSFGGYELIEELKKHFDKYSLKIVIVPDSARGKENLDNVYKSTRDFFVKKYGEDYIIDGMINGEFIDRTDEFDVIYYANPYDGMVPKIFGIEYASTQNVLPIHIDYGYTVSKWGTEAKFSSLEISLLWKVFSSTVDEQKLYEKNSLLRGKNVVLSGYAKMDSLLKFEDKPRTKKRVIIAPHHTIYKKSELSISTFLIYKDFFLTLPRKYPEFEFVFRPHPLLFTAMIQEGCWTQTNVDDYLNKLTKLGVVYSFGGDYFELFKNSDALIHDCASYIVEYLFLDKPCCYLLKNKKTLNIFVNYAKKCLKSYQIANSQKDVIKFLEQLKTDSVPKRTKKQTDFIDKEIKINFPYASSFIFENINGEF